MERIGILGGTFDPPHLGHLLVAEEVRLAMGLKEVWFIPTYTPPHKNAAKTTASERIKMLQLATNSNPFFKVNTIEIERTGKSYTLDTMEILKEQYPDKEFYFIIGADMVEYLPNWYKVDELFSIINFIGVKRSGYELNTRYPITEVDIPMIDISSTMLRKWLRSKRSVNYIIPDPVVSYIKENHLYGN
ncbi:nicotinate-nucleotide adenylyltransferase [Oceanobacillus rekensis]|uniref:nicotinate-nucleotide adenylyltransferase n=1 Tax=Oceanobacillus rekensis TaxID=937927 RepID=UPI000B436911|nr:nicotinate-nucleotide adenylyltransferase [Oceanobacillus rekensis]